MDTDWFIDYGHVTDADTTDPETEVTRWTPYPVHEGAACQQDECENRQDDDMRDFAWVEFGPDGNPHVAFTMTNGDTDVNVPVYVGPSETQR
jgi:hypothetical protein